MAPENGNRLYPGEYQLAKAKILAMMGNHKEARDTLNQEIKRKESDVISSTNIAQVFYLLGDHDQALNYLKAAIDEKDPFIPYLHIDGKWEKINDHPRFKALCKSINLPPKTRK